MSSDNKSSAGSKTNFASRLLNKAIQERKTGEMKKPEITAAQAERYATPASESKETVGRVK